jgi:hypothetical protein
MRDFLGWEAEFAEDQRVIVIANFKPNHDTARNIFAEDEAEIMAAAKRHGYEMIGSRKNKHVRFKKI